MHRSTLIRRRLATWLVLVGVVTLAACTPPTPPATAPSVTSFIATPTALVAGESASLAWDVADATSVAIATEAGASITESDDLAGDVLVTPTETTTYLLTATGPGGTAEAEATITVTDPAEPAPTIDTFTATPASIASGEESTLAWTTTDATSIEIQTLGGVPVHQTTEVDGTFVVTATVTTRFVLTATGPGGAATRETTVTVPGSEPEPVISSFTATVVAGSRLELAWAATGATSYQVVAVLAGSPTDTTTVVASTAATSATVAIPAANRQLLRLIATGDGGADAFEATPLNVVTNGLDYDTYNGSWWTVPAEDVVAGSLRAVVADAADGAVIGFASDVTNIALYGVNIFDPKSDAAYGPAGPGVATVDAHLNLLRDVTISGPVDSPVTIRSVAHPDSTDLDGFRWRSRVLFVPRGRTAALSNLRIADGTFIFVGAGVRNDGTLVMTDVLVENNRAWQFGGGIANVGGVLTLQRVTMRGNLAATLDAEVGEIFRIRQNTIEPIESAPVANLTTVDDGYGGGLANLAGPGAVVGSVSVVDSFLDANEAKLMGGGLYTSTGAVTFTDTDVTDNLANLEGYAPYPASRTDGLLSYGGGIGSGGAFAMSGGVVTGNHSTHIGGGFANFASGTATLTDVAFVSNTAEFYGCISNDADPADVVLTNVTCTNSGTDPIQGLGFGPSVQRAPAVAPNPSGDSLR